MRLWVDLGPLQFQPGELAKICLILFLAGYLREKREVLAQGRIKDFGPLLAIWGAAMLVIVQTNDLGSALLNFGIFLAMLYVATGKAAVTSRGPRALRRRRGLLYSAIDRVHERVTIWLTPWTDEPVSCALNGGELMLRQDCASYQLVKSLYSIGNGGFGGTGLGEGIFTSPDGAELIPHLRTDFIFSAITQELGLIGAAALLLVYMVFVVRGMRIALRAQDGFSKLLAAGLTFGFALQTFVIVGGILRIVPLTGITLPFVSYGGTSIVANFVLLAGLLLVSNRANALSANVNKQIVRLTYVALALVGVLVVMTTYWTTWAAAGLADRQDNAIKRVAEIAIDRGLILAAKPRRAARAQQAAQGRRQDALLPPLPARRRSRRMSSATPRSDARGPASSARSTTT